MEDWLSIINMRSTDRSPFRKEIEGALSEVGPYRSLRNRLQISGFLDAGYNWVVSLKPASGDYLVDRVEIEEEKIKPNLSAALSKSVGDFLGTYGKPDRIIVSLQRTVYVVNDGSEIIDPFNRTNLEVTKGRAVLEAKRGLTLTYPSGIAEVVEGLVLIFEPQTVQQVQTTDTGERRRFGDKIPAATSN